MFLIQIGGLHEILVVQKSFGNHLQFCHRYINFFCCLLSFLVIISFVHFEESCGVHRTCSAPPPPPCRTSTPQTPTPPSTSTRYPSYGQNMLSLNLEAHTGIFSFLVFRELISPKGIFICISCIYFTILKFPNHLYIQTSINQNHPDVLTTTYVFIFLSRKPSTIPSV